MTHTQGKWKVQGRHYGEQFRAETIEPNICEMSSSLPPNEVTANAALIAAAPAMYEALKGCERVTKVWIADMKDYPLINPEKAAATMELTRIQEALRLAEGRG